MSIPLILYDKQSKSWVGDPNILNLIEYASSQLSILDFELYKKTEKEYFKNRDVYDLSHNRPFLLMFNIYRLIRTCTQYTDANSVTANTVSTLKSWVNQSPKSLSKNAHLYPQICLDFLNDTMALIDQLSPYLPKDIIEAGLSNFKEELYNNFITNFYSNWEMYLKKPILWFNYCLDIVKNIPHKPLDRNNVGNTIQRFIARLSDTPHLTYEVGAIKNKKGLLSKVWDLI